MASYANFWIVEYAGEFYGTFVSEEECEEFAAALSLAPYEWTATQLVSPHTAIAEQNNG